MSFADARAPVTGYWHPPRGRAAYGALRGPGKVHPGIDIGGPVGRPVYAIGDLHVLRVVDDEEWSKAHAGFRGYGRVVMGELLDWPGTFVLYAHLEDATVAPGEKVRAGTMVGRMGKTAWTYDRGVWRSEFATSSAHLHLELADRPWPKAYGAGAIDPLSWFAAAGVIDASFEEKGATFRGSADDGSGSDGSPGGGAPPPFTRV